jgi:hypothetical protein
MFILEFTSDKSIFMWSKTSAVDVKYGRYYIGSTGENVYFAIYISMTISRTKLSDRATNAFCSIVLYVMHLKNDWNVNE